MHIDAVDEGTLKRFAPLQAIVCCPHDRSPLILIGRHNLLRLLPESEQARVSPETQGAFFSESSGRAYPIQSNVVNFLEHDALGMDDQSTTPKEEIGLTAAAVKRSVKEWYDQFGWRQNEMGMYNDTALFSHALAAQMTGYRLYTLLSHLSLVGRLSGGDFFLDAASGAIPLQEYLLYSWFYKYRVCVDMSLTALMEANAKIGTAGFCCLADMCHLPFRDDAFDGGVSAYTIQHIPQTEQARAVSELYRVLCPDRNMYLITHRKNSWEHRLFMLTLRALRKLLFLRHRTYLTENGQVEGSKQPHSLYCFLADLKWWRDRLRDLGSSFNIEGLRSLEKFEFEWIFENSPLAARRLRFWESFSPRLAARLSPYLLIEMRKGR